MKAEKILGMPGKMISGSKSLYTSKFPDNMVIFNANVCTDKEKIWYGDLDITKDEKKIIQLAKELNTKVYVLFESDARFNNEKNPLLDRAVYTTDGQTNTFDESFIRTRGKIKFKREDLKNGLIYFKDINIFKGKEPLTKFYDYISKRLRISFKGLSVSDIQVSQETETILRYLTSEYERKKIKDSSIVERRVSYLFFDMGPSVSEEVQDGYILVDMTNLRSKK